MQKKLGILLAAFVICFMGSIIRCQAYTQTSGTVTANSAKIRQEANVSSAALGSLKSGDTVTIIDEATDSSGALWYQVWVNADTKGYVRSDLVQKSGASASSSTASTASTTTAETTLPKTDVTAIESQAATITGGDVRVRAGAGTAYDAVTSVKKGTAVTLTGTATGTDSQKWYQVSFINNGATVTGFIRADLVQIGTAATTEEESDTPEVTEAETATGEETTEETAVETEANTGDEYTDLPEESTEPACDYELVNAADSDGNYVWYLYNNAEGVRMKLDDLIAAGTTNAEALEEAEDTVSKQKMIIIIMAIGLVLFALAITLLAFKVHDLSDGYDDDDDDDDSDEYDEDSELFRKRKLVKKVARPEDATENSYGKKRLPQDGRQAQKRPVSNRPMQSPDAQRTPVNRQRPNGQRPIDGQRPQQPSQRTNGQGRPDASHQQRPTGSGRAMSEKRPSDSRRPMDEQNAVGTRPNNGSTTRAVDSKKQEVTWKSKNFLTEDDDMELSFLDHNGKEDE